jgi:hypothetical protein
LLETFVDPKFSGTSYKAANWISVGESSGRRDGIRRQVFVYPLISNCKKLLCSTPQKGLSGKGFENPKNWTEEEFGNMRIFDDRLKTRVSQIAEDFYNSPTANIPQACGTKAKTLATYRFFQNPKITMEMLLTPHIEATVQRIRKHKVVLLPQDTTTLTYSHPATEGLGPVGTLNDQAVGLLMHDTLAFSEEGLPLGIAGAQVWARDPEEKGSSALKRNLPIEQKESMKWLRSFRRACEIQKLCPDTMIVSMGDRESDIYELFQEALKDPQNAKLLVRSERSRQRKVEEGYLWDLMEKEKPAGELKIHIPRKPSHPAHDALMTLRYKTVILQPPKNKDLLPLEIQAVYLKEKEGPIEWMLLTTATVKTFQQAKKCVEWYAGRWGIEVFHRTLKSGCEVLNRQLSTAERLESCLAIDMVIAWRILHLTMLGRETPHVPATVFFKEIEWKVLYCLHYNTPILPKKTPTLMESVRMVAQLGGHLGRKSDGFPGPQTIWRGLEKLSIPVRYAAISAGLPIPDYLGLKSETFYKLKSGP